MVRRVHVEHREARLGENLGNRSVRVSCCRIVGELRVADQLPNHVGIQHPPAALVHVGHHALSPVLCDGGIGIIDKIRITERNNRHEIHPSSDTSPHLRADASTVPPYQGVDNGIVRRKGYLRVRGTGTPMSVSAFFFCLLQRSDEAGQMGGENCLFIGIELAADEIIDSRHRLLSFLVGLHASGCHPRFEHPGGRA